LIVLRPGYLDDPTDANFGRILPSRPGAGKAPATCSRASPQLHRGSAPTTSDCAKY